ncbi:hypothetical protein GQR58_005070 [Nymphon striatum]|nr:hypothetical protein GQR58_005070 [Nymphon striatum]
MAQDSSSVDLELVLAVDTSSSIDAVEYVLQTDGYVKAFQDDESVDWTPVFDGSSSRLFAEAIKQNAINETSSGTAIGEALLFSASLFDNNGFSEQFDGLEDEIRAYMPSVDTLEFAQR